MTEEQQRHALALCDLILETAARLQADLREAKEAIEQAVQQDPFQRDELEERRRLTTGSPPPIKGKLHL